MSTPWPLGTDASRELKTRISAFLEARFKGAYASRLPPRRFVFVKDANERSGKKAGILVWVYAGEDEQPARSVQGGTYEEEWHKLTFDIEADSKTGGGAVVESVFATLRSIFNTASEREVLAGLGIYNVRQSSEPLDAKDVDFARPFTLTCSTDTALL